MQNSDLLEHDTEALNNGVEFLSAIIDDGRQPPKFDKSWEFFGSGFYVANMEFSGIIKFS